MLHVVVLLAVGHINVDAGVFAASPTLLGTGLLLGPTADVGVGSGAFAFGGRARLGFVEEPDLSWRVRHTELRVEAFVSYRLAVGVGVLGLRGGAGGLWLNENRSRHQGDRLAGADADQRAAVGGVFTSAGPEWRVVFADPWQVIVGLGPTVAVLFREQTNVRAGWSGSLQIGLALGGAP